MWRWGDGLYTTFSRQVQLVNLNDFGIIIVKSDRLHDFKRNLLPYYLFHITYIPDNNTIAVTL